MNEKIKELIDWCQEEIDYRIKIVKENSPNRQTALNQKTILDTVKDKLCSIYEDDTQMTRLKSDYKKVVRQMNRDEAIEAINEGDLAYCDDFLCSKCGIHLTDWFRMDAKEDDRYEYEFKFCPNCGAKIVNHD